MAALAKAKAAGIRAYPNRVPAASSITNDPIYNITGNDWNLTAIHAKEAWDALKIANADAPVAVGVIDGGFRFGHEDVDFTRISTGSINFDASSPLAAALGFHACEPVDDPSKGICKSATHGMNVSGIIAAKSNNSKGMAGVAPGLGLMGYNVTSNGYGVMDGVYWMVESGVKAVNISWGYNYDLNPWAWENCNFLGCSGGGSERDNYYVDVVKDFKKKYPTFPDILIVQSSGNNGDMLHKNLQSWLNLFDDPIDQSDYNGFFATIVSKNFNYPPELDSYIDQIRAHTIIVGSYGNSGGIADFTSLPSNKNITPFMLAPGGGSGGRRYINGDSVNDRVAGAAYSATDKYIAQSGTSQAAPHVTGVAALILKANPNLSAVEVRNIILNNADTLGPVNTIAGPRRSMPR